MNDARWLDIEADIVAAKEHFTNACALYNAGGFDGAGLDGYRARMALMHAMQSAHTSAEAGLLRLLRLLGEEPPQGEDWHYRLIERLRRIATGSYQRPAVLPDAVANDLHETRSFRHRVSHGYGDFDVRRAWPSLEAADRLSRSLPEAIEQFRHTIDPA